MLGVSRNRTDPLKELFKAYGIKLLNSPRQSGISLGQVYAFEEDYSFNPAQGLLKNPITIEPSEVARGPLTPFKGVFSDFLDAKIGFEYLKELVRSLIGSPLNINLGYSKIQYVNFSFPTLSENSIDLGLLGTKLIGNSFNKLHPLYAEDRKYFIITSLILTNSFSIGFFGSSKKQIDVDLTTIVTSGLSKYPSSSLETSYQGINEIVFGIKAVEIVYNESESRFIYAIDKDVKGFRGHGKIADREGDDNIFVEIKTAG